MDIALNALIKATAVMEIEEWARARKIATTYPGIGTRAEVSQTHRHHVEACDYGECWRLFGDKLKRSPGADAEDLIAYVDGRVKAIHPSDKNPESEFVVDAWAEIRETIEASDHVILTRAA